VNLPNAVEPGRTHDQRVTWTARATLAMTAHIRGYLSYATGFKASSINLSRDSRPFASDQPALEAAGLAQVNQTYATRFAGPERTIVYELGLKAEWGLATANLALFQQTISGFQSNLFTGTGFALVNAGKERVRGVELETALRPAAGLVLSGSATGSIRFTRISRCRPWAISPVGARRAFRRCRSRWPGNTSIAWAALRACSCAPISTMKAR
jgi:outer membrane receptor protein involved in Fe transport